MRTRLASATSCSSSGCSASSFSQLSYMRSWLGLRQLTLTTQAQATPRSIVRNDTPCFIAEALDGVRNAVPRRDRQVDVTSKDLADCEKLRVQHGVGDTNVVIFVVVVGIIVLVVFTAAAAATTRRRSIPTAATTTTTV